MKSLGCFWLLAMALLLQGCGEKVVTEYEYEDAQNASQLPTSKVFVNRAPESECPGGIRAAIKVEEDKPVVQIRENCADITPRTLEAGSFSFTSSDPTIMITDRLYDMDDPMVKTTSVIYCIGTTFQYKAEYQLRTKLNSSGESWLRLAYIAPYGMVRFTDRSLVAAQEPNGTRRFTATVENVISPDQSLMELGLSNRNVLAGDINTIDLSITPAVPLQTHFGSLVMNPSSNPATAMIEELMGRTGGSLKMAAELRNCYRH